MIKIYYQPKAIKQLRKISAQKLIREKISALIAMFHCDSVKALTGHPYQYKLQIGSYRIFFNFVGVVSIISIEKSGKT